MRATLAVIVLALAGCGGSTGEGGKPVVFQARSSDGSRVVSTVALRGQPVLLTTWATWCTACREELPAVERLYARERARGLRVVAVNVNADGVGYRAKELVASLGLTMPVWSDPGHAFSAQFTAIGVPTTVLLDASGRVVRIWQGGIEPGRESDVAVVERTLSGKAA